MQQYPPQYPSDPTQQYPQPYSDPTSQQPWQPPAPPKKPNNTKIIIWSIVGVVGGVFILMLIVGAIVGPRQEATKSTEPIATETATTTVATTTTTITIATTTLPPTTVPPPPPPPPPPVTEAPAPKAVTTTTAAKKSAASYANCKEAKAAGVTPIYEGEPGYSKKLDGDGDGVACE